jgi:hypothetical protein
MDVKVALLGQYRAGLAMLRNCIEVCPDDVWRADSHPRTFWRIVYHATFYTHLYLAVDYESFQPWEKHCWHGPVLWDDGKHDAPPVETTYTQAELLEYVAFVEANLDGWLREMDLEAQTSGFSWYAVPKLDHQLVNIRHLGVHIGQLQERLTDQGIETEWVRGE